MNNQEQNGSKEIEEKYKLISKYAIAQYEFEKIIGFKRAIRLTVDTKKQIIGHGYLSDAPKSKLLNLLAKLRYLYAQVVKNNQQFPTKE